MLKDKIKVTALGLGMASFLVLGLGSCSKGTEPGETNVERSEIRDEGELVSEDNDAAHDTLSGESHYDHADHENHDDNTNEVIGDGAYDGKGDGVQRDEVQQ